MMKRLFAILLSLAMLLSVTAVFAEGDAEAAVPDTLLLTVNGQEIRENNEKLQHYLSELLSGSEETDELFMHVARMFAMNYTLQEIMLLERATANGPVDEEALRQQAEINWNNSVEQIMANLSGITEDSSEEDRIAARADALSYIESNYGYTEESFVAEMVQNMPLNTAYTDILNELKTTRTDLTATEEDILAAYNDVVKEEMEGVGNDIQMYEFYQQYYGYTFHYVPEGYRGILHILLKVDQELLDQWTDLSARLEEAQNASEVTGDAEPTEAPAETEEPVTEEMVEAARQAILDSQKETIDTIKARLADGESFESLIAEFGTDPGMQNEDYLKNGYTVHPDSVQYDTNFTKAAAALEKVGDISDPVISSFGIHILYYLRDVPAGPMEITEEERAQLQSDIEEENLNLAFSEYFDAWVAGEGLVWTEEGEGWKFDQTVYDQYLNSEAEELEETEEDAGTETEEVPAT